MLAVPCTLQYYSSSVCTVYEQTEIVVSDDAAEELLMVIQTMIEVVSISLFSLCSGIDLCGTLPEFCGVP